MHPNEELARRELEALESGDLDAAAALYADDLILHYPGRNPLAGDHRDLDGFLERFRSLLGEDGTITRELHDVLGSDDHAVQLIAVEAEAQIDARPPQSGQQGERLQGDADGRADPDGRGPRVGDQPHPD